MEAKLKQRIKQIIREQIVTSGNKQLEDIDFEINGEDYAIFLNAGIKEVVEDFKTVLDAPARYRLGMFLDILDDWQVKLKV